VDLLSAIAAPRQEFVPTITLIVKSIVLILWGNQRAFLTTIRIGGMGMTPFIKAGLVFGSAGVPPVGSRGVKARKITGETPALPKPLPKPSFNSVAPAKRKLREKCGMAGRSNVR
jgi:hypothetical protein